MTIDYTKLLAKLDPQPGGEDVARMRTGVVDAVNADGTVDLGISGIVVPDVPRLAGTVIADGDVVQVISYRGSLLVLGRVATFGASGPMVDRGTVMSPTFPVASNFFTLAVSFNVTFPSTPNVHINLNSSSGNWNGWTWMAFGISTTGFTLLGRSLSSSQPASVPFQWTAIWTP